MNFAESQLLRALARRIRDIRESASEEYAGGHHALREVLIDAPNSAPEQYRWSSQWSHSRIRYRRRHRESVRRGTLKRFGAALTTFDHALAAAEFANRSMLESYLSWSHGSPSSEVDRDVLGVPDIVGGKSVKLLLLAGMHARIITLADEILIMLRSGHWEAASSRLRTQYETATKACLIANDPTPSGYDLAERYYVSSYIEAHGRQWMTMGLTGTEEVLRNAAFTRWGPSFFQGENNWAAPAIQDSTNRRITFKAIEEAADFATIRHIYQECNEHVHAGPGRTISAANFESDYLFSARPELDLHKTSRIGQASAFLLEFSTIEILRCIVVDTSEWDQAYSAAEFIRLIGRANSHFLQVRSRIAGRESEF